MAVNNLLDTSTVSLSDIIGNGKTYTVPPYQRDYSWGKDQWEDLWNDILSVHETGNVHYMGSIVLQNMGDKKYHVIDGQQRFSTLTLIVLSIINKLNQLIKEEIEIDNNKERVSLLSKKYIGDKDPASLTYSSKLQLNENNNSFFQSNLLVFRPPTNFNTLLDSDKQLWNAYLYFIDSVNLFFKNEKDGEIITNFLNKHIAEKLMFIQIIVEDELSAYTVFETLNSRGVGLTVTDLLKNYLFSIASKVDLPHIKSKWKKIVDIIGLDNFPTFLRHYWVSKNKLIRQEYLFRAIKESINDSPAVILLLDSLEENARLYKALSNYADTFWSGHRDIKKRIKELTLFKEKQAYSILIAAYNNLNQEDFCKVLKLVSVITFRYTVIAKLHTNLKEDVYNKAAIQISLKEVNTIGQIAEIIRPLYPNDKDFKNDFSSKSISTKRGKKLVRYILFSLENHLSGADYDFEENPGTIEHILPENGHFNYILEFPPAIHESVVYRLGNYTLLEEDKNRACETLPFEEKKVIFVTSKYELSKEIQSNTWTPNSIDIRQDRLANYASSVWRISQYD
ncbi:DUF262 domain-containing HNH endonuclease family protein [Arenibacter sp. GZD96]|uniref:DUF262 domain-containing protein n=1 Tax=Aurantibrevibacter litoralis TaxID=3106030 RepID=UPI002AFEABEB|nr:DUF262 domain-containing HNH endonuclease family protein [Arenibacter sp. GZD-96]MEA1785638.1 DUF262 domain-containing HNH endonuclease family protein [Arenibacter sp. GZD-96]